MRIDWLCSQWPPPGRSASTKFAPGLFQGVGVSGSLLSPNRLGLGQSRRLLERTHRLEQRSGGQRLPSATHRLWVRDLLGKAGGAERVALAGSSGKAGQLLECAVSRSWGYLRPGNLSSCVWGARRPLGSTSYPFPPVLAFFLGGTKPEKLISSFQSRAYRAASSLGPRDTPVAGKGPPEPDAATLPSGQGLGCARGEREVLALLGAWLSPRDCEPLKTPSPASRVKAASS